MANVLFKRGQNPDDFIVEDGQLVYDTDSGHTYEDVGPYRIPTSLIIDDTKATDTETWSSEKVMNMFGPVLPSLTDLKSRITALENKAEPLPQPVK